MGFNISLVMTDNAADRNHNLCSSATIPSCFELEIVPSSSVVHIVYISGVHMFAVHFDSFLGRTLTVGQAVDIATAICVTHSSVRYYSNTNIMACINSRLRDHLLQVVHSSRCYESAPHHFRIST